MGNLVAHEKEWDSRCDSNSLEHTKLRKLHDISFLKIVLASAKRMDLGDWEKQNDYEALQWPRQEGWSEKQEVAGVQPLYAHC